MTYPSLTSEMDAATALLHKAVASFTLEKFNHKTGDKWSASQIIEHLLMVESSINKIIGTSAGEAGRAADKKLEGIASAMANDDEQYPAPEMFLPAGAYSDFSVLDRLTEIRNQLKEKMATINLEEMISFKHPGLGYFTRLEWIHFIIHHSNRHARQIESLSQQAY